MHRKFVERNEDVRWEGFPGGSDGKESAWSAGDLGLIPEGRSPGGGNGYPLLGDPMDRGSWQLQSMGSQGVGHD